jgi:hypothetical protein
MLKIIARGRSIATTTTDGNTFDHQTQQKQATKKRQTATEKDGVNETDKQKLPNPFDKRR